MSSIGLAEFLLLATAAVLLVFGRNIPEFLQSLVLSKKQFAERRSQVHKGENLIDYISELAPKRDF